MHNRRQTVAFLLAGVTGALGLPRAAFAQSSSLLPLTGDDGQPMTNYRLPSELSPYDLPGTVWVGPENADIMLVEFFDYNCPFCRRASAEIDAMLSKDRNLRVGLVDNAILGPGSYLAARVAQAVLKLYGPKKAYDFHKRLFANRGPNDGVSALATAKAMNLDAPRVESAANEDIIATVLKRQIMLARDLGFATTPSFALNGVGILGYPGRTSLSRMITSARKCDRPACDG